jgi:hypothetical protein
MSTHRLFRGTLMGLGACAAVAAVGASTWWLLRDDAAPAEPSAATPTAEATASATGTAPAAVTAAPTADGSPAISQLTIREDGEFPPGTAMLVATGPYGKGGGGYFRVPAAIAITSTGALKSYTTTALMSSEEAMDAMRRRQPSRTDLPPSRTPAPYELRLVWPSCPTSQEGYVRNPLSTRTASSSDMAVGDLPRIVYVRFSVSR